MTAAILDLRPKSPSLASLFALDRPPAGGVQLVCRWRRDAAGRLACAWEPEIGASPER